MMPSEIQTDVQHDNAQHSLPTHSISAKITGMFWLLHAALIKTRSSLQLLCIPRALHNSWIMPLILALKRLGNYCVNIRTLALSVTTEA